MSSLEVSSRSVRSLCASAWPDFGTSAIVFAAAAAASASGSVAPAAVEGVTAKSDAHQDKKANKGGKKKEDGRGKSSAEMRCSSIVLADEPLDVMAFGDTVKHPPQRLYNAFLRKTLGEQQKAGSTSPSQFRVLTYNILLDAFCDSDWALEHIFPYVRNRRFVRRDYRQQLVLDDLKAIDPDVICLQEVQGPVFTRYLDLHLQSEGYVCLYANKKSVQPFGSCVCFRTTKFELVSSEIIDLTTEWQNLPEATRLVEQAPKLPEGLVRSTTIAHCVRLRDRASHREVVVVNNHLYSSPNGSNVRIIQAATMLQYVQKHHPNMPAVICGDLNTRLESGVMRLMLAGIVEGDHPEWAEGDQFDAHRADKQEEREFDWHSVIVWNDIAFCRRLFIALDMQRTGFIPTEALHDAITASVADVGTLAQELPPTVDYRRLFRFFQDLKLHSRESFYQFLASLRDRVPAATIDGQSSIVPVPIIAKPQNYAHCELRHDMHLALCHADIPCTYLAFDPPEPTVNDFMLHTRRLLKCVYEVPGPSFDMLTVEKAIPSSQHPSDHIPLAADYDFGV
eukprot:m.172368 g.172368  ORF g.172368 m.172368 type:complete len:565 (-) comp17293_c2_seq1:1066-2760(-)